MLEPESAKLERGFHLLVRRLYRLRSRLWLLLLVASIVYLAARHNRSSFKMIRVDRDISGSSDYPVAVSPELVGSYPPNTKSGAGYFYDDVLEYRVWLHPYRGADSLNGDQDYFEAFAQYEKARHFSETTKGAEEPLVLVRQREWIDEPQPGHFVPEKGERITEWRVKWLARDHRTSESIQEFMKHPRAGQKEDDTN